MGLRDKTTMEAPRGYSAQADDRSWRSIAIMEDIAATRGARFVGPTERLSREQMHDIVTTLACMHGQLWEDPAINVLHTLREYIQRTTAMVALRDRAEVGMERAKHEIPAGLQGQADRIYNATVASLGIGTDQMPQTLLHGDAHVGQTYVTGEGRMGYADWHHCLRGGWAYDFAYCVNSACEPEDRREWERGLMETYLKALAEYGGAAASFDEAWLAYRQQCFWPFVAWVFTIGRAYSSAGDAARRPLPGDHPPHGCHDRRSRLVRCHGPVAPARILASRTSRNLLQAPPAACCVRGTQAAGGGTRGGAMSPPPQPEAWDPLHSPSAPGLHWSTVNAGEAVPGVQTPLSWTMWTNGSEASTRHAAYARGDDQGRATGPARSQPTLRARVLRPDRDPGRGSRPARRSHARHERTPRRSAAYSATCRPTWSSIRRGAGTRLWPTGCPRRSSRSRARCRGSPPSTSSGAARSWRRCRT